MEKSIFCNFLSLPSMIFLVVVWLNGMIFCVFCDVIYLRNPYRIDVELTRFEDYSGVKHNGRSCDSFFASPCDPMIYAAIRTDDFNPLITQPRTTSKNGFELVLYMRNQNHFYINRIIQKKVCNTTELKLAIKLFARVIDHDVLKTDLMEDFTCAVATDNDHGNSYNHWSDVADCRARYQPGKIKLSYRWRLVALGQSDCDGTESVSDLGIPTDMPLNRNTSKSLIRASASTYLASFVTQSRSKQHIRHEVYHHGTPEDLLSDYTVLSGRRERHR